MKGLLKAGLLAAFVGGMAIIPAQEADAMTRCRDVYTRGVHKQICTTRPTPHRYQTVCSHYYRHGVRYESCRKVKVRRY
jgi:hypothetical protein